MADRFVSALADGTGSGTLESSPWTLAQARDSANGDEVWIKADGDYLMSTLGVLGFDPVNVGNRFRGYLSSPGDLDYPAVVFDGQGADSMIIACSKEDTVFENITARNNASSGFNAGVEVSGKRCLLRRMRATDVGGYGFRLAGTGCVAEQCEADAYSQALPLFAGFFGAANHAQCRHCFAHDSAGYGFQASADIKDWVHCIAAELGLSGFFSTRNPGVVISLIGCISTGNTDGVGAANPLGSDVDVVNSIMGGNEFGIHGTIGTARVDVFGLARFGNTNEIGGSVDLRLHADPVDLSGDPFVNSTGPDYNFTLKPQFRKLLGSALPGRFIVNGQRSNWQSFFDYGPVQGPVRPVINPFTR